MILSISWLTGRALNLPILFACWDRGITDEELEASAAFRSESRLPVLTWGSSASAASIWRWVGMPPSLQEIVVVILFPFHICLEWVSFFYPGGGERVIHTYLKILIYLIKCDRSSQPKVGVSGSCPGDERLLQLMALGDNSQVTTSSTFVLYDVKLTLILSFT